MHNTWKWSRIALVAMTALLVGIVAGCGDDDEADPGNQLSQYDSHVVTAWFDLFNVITKVEKLTPPVASRAFAYEGVALYEAIVPGLATHKSLVGQLNGLESLPQPLAGAGYHWPTVANAALAGLARHLYAGTSAISLQLIDDLDSSFQDEFRPLAGTAVFDRSVARGQAVGEAIFNWAFDDGAFENHNCDYIPPQGSGLWVPTPTLNLPALEPCWGENRNFILDIPSRCEPLPPLPFDDGNPEAPFYIEMRQVYMLRNSLSNEQREIATFWADGSGTATPPGHWFALLNQLTTERGWTLDVTCEAYAKLGIAAGESFISCWRAKYIHNYIRPVTCIRNSFQPSWNSFIVTPPFPEYPSGHSVQSRAAAEVLSDLFGHFAFVDRTHDGDGSGLAPRSFADFFAASDEAAISRLYGGIHFQTGIDAGIQQGTCLGEKVNALEFEK